MFDFLLNEEEKVIHGTKLFIELVSDFIEKYLGEDLNK